MFFCGIREIDAIQCCQQDLVLEEFSMATLILRSKKLVWMVG